MEVMIEKEAETILNKWEIQNCALNKVIAICGTIENLSKLLGLEKKKGADRIKKWRNGDIRIPLGYAIVMEYLTGVSFELLSPFTEKTNKILRKSMMADELPIVNVPCQDITIPKNLLSAHPVGRPIIVTTDLALISGLEQLVTAKTQGKTEIPAVVLNLEALRLRIKKLKSKDFLISEQVAISFALKPLMGSYQGKRNDLLKPKSDLKKYENTALLGRKRNKVKRIDEELADIVGFKNKDALHRATKICKKGIPLLINVLNDEKIALTKAAEFAECSPNTQHKSILEHLAAKGELHVRT